MIRSSKELSSVLGGGVTVVRLTEMGGGTHFHWATSDTNEPVHSGAIKALEKRGEIRVVARDLCGDPMQMGRA